MKTGLKSNINVKTLRLDEICRFCLSKDGILLSIFGFEEGSKLFELPFQLRTILSVEVSKIKFKPTQSVLSEAQEVCRVCG